MYILIAMYLIVIGFLFQTAMSNLDVIKSTVNSAMNKNISDRELMIHITISVVFWLPLLIILMLMEIFSSKKKD